MSNLCPPPTHSIAFRTTDGRILAVYHLIENALIYSLTPLEVGNAKIAGTLVELEVVKFNNMGMFYNEMKEGKYINRVDMRSSDPADWSLVEGFQL